MIYATEHSAEKLVIITVRSVKRFADSTVSILRYSSIAASRVTVRRCLRVYLLLESEAHAPALAAS
jgi:hypothetical protein